MRECPSPPSLNIKKPRRGGSSGFGELNLDGSDQYRKGTSIRVVYVFEWFILKTSSLLSDLFIIGLMAPQILLSLNVKDMARFSLLR